MKHSIATWFMKMMACTLLVACGGGGGGDSPKSAPVVPAQVEKSLASLSTPKDFDFSNFVKKTITWNQVITKALMNAASMARVTDNKIHVQIWYLDASNTRQSLAITTLAAFKSSYPSGMTLSHIPKAVSRLQAESYFWDTAQKKTITTEALEVAL